MRANSRRVSACFSCGKCLSLQGRIPMEMESENDTKNAAVYTMQNPKQANTFTLS